MPVTKKMLWVIFIALFTISLAAGVGLAATAKDCKAKAQAAAAMLAKEGKAGFAQINDKKGKWAADPYVFVFDFKGNVIAHPNPKLIGKNFVALKDVKGNMFAAEFLSVGTGAGKGWVEYWWPKLGEKKPSQKVSYVVRVPGKKMLAIVGVYGYGKAKAIAEAGE